MNLHKNYVERVSPIGYVLLTKDMKIPDKIEDIKLLPFDQGPVNLRVMKPFRIWQSYLETSSENSGEMDSLKAYVNLLVAALKTIEHAKGSFVLYLELRALHNNYMFVGGVYKYA